MKHAVINTVQKTLGKNKFCVKTILLFVVLVFVFLGCILIVTKMPIDTVTWNNICLNIIDSDKIYFIQSHLAYENGDDVSEIYYNASSIISVEDEHNIVLKQAFLSVKFTDRILRLPRNKLGFVPEFSMVIVKNDQILDVIDVTLLYNSITLSDGNTVNLPVSWKRIVVDYWRVHQHNIVEPLSTEANYSTFQKSKLDANNWIKRQQLYEVVSNPGKYRISKRGQTPKAEPPKPGNETGSDE